jgi:fatty-acyl-CoA synthase
MAAIELRPERSFDPTGFAAYLRGQPDLGTKWAPRFVRVIGALPVSAANKVDKKPLRAAAWNTDDPVWWRPPREDAYRPLTDADRDRLGAAFAEHGREALLTG